MRRYNLKLHDESTSMGNRSMLNGDICACGYEPSPRMLRIAEPYV